MPSSNHTLFQQQHIFQIEAKKVISKLDLEKILSQHGEIQYVGSYPLNLMVWRDIDLDLFFKNKSEIKMSFWKIVKTFSYIENVQLILLANNLDHKTEKNRPKSMYIGLKFKFAENIWKFDIRLLEKKDDTALNYLNSINQELNQQNRLIILTIKNYFKNHLEYGKEFSGYHIYEAVLKHNVKSISEFEHYLQNK